MVNGTLITFEGGEGTGKSTQIRLLCDHLQRRGRDVVMTREPGGTGFAEAVRAVLLDPRHQPDGLSEYFLLASCRHDHVERKLRPALEAGSVILCDRYSDSSIVYQGYVRGVGEETIEELDRLATGGLAPDLTFVLDLDPLQALSRVHQRNAEDHNDQSRLDDEETPFHLAVREGFLRLAERHPERIRVVDGGTSIEEIHRRIINLLPTDLQ